MTATKEDAALLASPSLEDDSNSRMHMADDATSIRTGRSRRSVKSSRSTKSSKSSRSRKKNIRRLDITMPKAEKAEDILEDFEREMSASQAPRPQISTELTFSAEGMTIKQLPWTKEDSQQVMDQITFLEKEVHGHVSTTEEGKSWQEKLAELRGSLIDAIQQDRHSGILSREDPLLQKLASTMGGINLVDMQKLTTLMRKNQRAGDCMDGRDVILLCGETGSGKTTTLHFLLGSTFEEIEVDGFVHLHPSDYLDESHAHFKTSYTREPTTRSLQAATVRVNDEEVAVCDIPSYDVANCVEEDIALGLGMVQALRRAKSIRPVVVLSRDGMGNRFSSLPEAMRIVSRLCNITKAADWRPFGYVFTKYDEKHRRMLHKQFSALERNPPKIGSGQSQEIFEAFITDIADKTHPEANVILPLEGHPANILASLMDGSVADPQDLCQAYASSFSLKKLKLQMAAHLFHFRGCLLQEDYPKAIQSIKTMIFLAALFPEMQSNIRQAKEAFLQQVAQVWVLVVRSIGKQDYHTALYRMEQLNMIAKDFPDAVECIELGHEMLSQSVTEPIANKQYRTSILRMIELSKLQERFKEASTALGLGLSKLQEKIESILFAKDYDMGLGLTKDLGLQKDNITGADAVTQHCLALVRGDLIEAVSCKQYEESIKLIKALSQVDLPEAFEIALHGLHLVREKLTTMIDNEDFERGMQLTKEISRLGQDFIEANNCVRKVLKAFRKRIDDTVQEGDCAKAADLLRSLSELGDDLTDGTEYIQFAFNMAAQQVCELRMEVVNAFEAILKVKKDLKRYSQLLEYSLLSMSMLLESEPMRLVCSEYYHKTIQAGKGDLSAFKPNYLAILCTPKDCTSEAFCVAQIQHMVETIADELTEIQMERASVENLMMNRKSLLSVVLRLRTAANAFNDAPGGGLAVTLYTSTFSKFQALIGSVLAMSEATFDSSIKMKEFELQTWFLAFLIQGFMRDIDYSQEKGHDIQAMEDLDHRRVTLMLRFENEISDTMDLLNNYAFPDFQVDKTPPDFATFFQEVSLKDWEAPRQLLLSLSQAPQLCKMMATMVSSDEAKKAVSSLDKSMTSLFAGIIKYLEEAYEKVIHELKIKRISYKVAAYDAKKISEDIAIIRPELTAAQGWSEESTKSEIAPMLERLEEINTSIETLISKLGTASAEEDITPAGFVMALFSAGGALSCACFGPNQEDEFLTSLPVLSKLEPPPNTTLPVTSPVNSLPVLLEESPSNLRSEAERVDNEERADDNAEGDQPIGSQLVSKTRAEHCSDDMSASKSLQDLIDTAEDETETETEAEPILVDGA